MHHRHLDAAVVMRGDVTGVSETGFLRNRQGIELRAQHDHGARAVLEDANHTVAAHSGGDVVSELAKLVGDLGRSLLLVIRKLGIAVQVEIERFDLGIDGINLRGCDAPGLGGPRGYGERRHGERHEKKQEMFHSVHVKFPVNGIRPQTAEAMQPGGDVEVSQAH